MIISRIKYNAAKLENFRQSKGPPTALQAWVTKNAKGKPYLRQRKPLHRGKLTI